MNDFNEMKLRQLDFSLLLIFQEIYRGRRAAAAAERFALSQPAVSHALGRLRHVLGDRLFVRHPSGMRPTARAIELAPKVDAILGLAVGALQTPAKFDPRASGSSFAFRRTTSLGRCSRSL
jgi:DNA-binding transcriptional LysR family regulator